MSSTFPSVLPAEKQFPTGSTREIKKILTANEVLSLNPISPSLYLQVFHANTDATEVVLNRIPQPVLARFVRIRPQTWKNGIALRFELYGCQITGKKDEGSWSAEFLRPFQACLLREFLQKHDSGLAEFYTSNTLALRSQGGSQNPNSLKYFMGNRK